MRRSITTTTLVALTTTFAYLGWRRIRRCFEGEKPFEELPTAPDAHWLHGHRIFLRGDFRDYLKQLISANTNEYGQVGLWLFWTRTLAVTSWQDARMILQNEHRRKRFALIEKHVNMFLGPRNIGVLVGREWKYHRAAILRSFSLTTVKASKKTIVEVVDTVKRSLNQQIEASCTKSLTMEVDQLMKMITFDVFGKVAFSQDLGCTRQLSPSPLAVAFDYLGDELSRRARDPFKPTNYFYWIPTPTNLRHRRERTLLRSFLTNAIAERRSSSEKKADMLSELLSTLQEDDDPLMDKRLQDILLALLFAGYDTTSITLSYAVALLSQHPEVEHELVKEVTRAKEPIDDLDDLRYCQAVFYETLRLFPPATATSRYLHKSIQLQGGFVAPADSFVIVPIWLIQNDQKHFPQPESFRPDRWVRRQGENGTSRWVDREEGDSHVSDIPAANRKAFFAFSAGGRSCAGQKFAMHEGVLVLANLIKTVRFRMAEGYELSPVRRGLLQGPKDGLPMTIKLR